MFTIIVAVIPCQLCLQVFISAVSPGLSFPS